MICVVKENNYKTGGGVRGRVVKVIVFKPFDPHCFEEAIQLAYGTSVALLWCPFVPEIMHGRASEVFLNQ
jgi:hypothetical protein